MTVALGLSEILSGLTVIVGLVVWLIRLEGRVNFAQNLVNKLEVRHESLDNKIVNKLSDIEKALAKIEGRLSIENEQNRSL